MSFYTVNSSNSISTNNYTIPKRNNVTYIDLFFSYNAFLAHAFYSLSTCVLGIHCGVKTVRAIQNKQYRSAAELSASTIALFALSTLSFFSAWNDAVDLINKETIYYSKFKKTI